MKMVKPTNAATMRQTIATGKIFLNLFIETPYNYYIIACFYKAEPWYNSNMWFELCRKFVRFVDPKLEKYRDKKPAPVYTPKTLEDFIAMLRRTPRSILSADDRKRIAAVMGFDGRRVRDLMTSKDKMVFVSEREILGPLVLDRLYKSGFTSFPVVDEKERVVGVIHTDALNALEIKNTDRAEKYMDRQICHLKAGDTLRQAVEEIERTHENDFLVLGPEGELAGFFTVQMLLDYLVG